MIENGREKALLQGVLSEHPGLRPQRRARPGIRFSRLGERFAVEQRGPALVEQQFITRKKENKDTLTSFEALLNDYFSSDKPAQFGTPTVAYCAERLHLSANYFGDLIKKETAKEMLADPTRSVSEVAYALGYQYPQYFSRAFKRIVGCPPNRYRSSN